MRKAKPTKTLRQAQGKKELPIGSRFGRKLQEARLAHGSSQKEVATRIDTNVTTVSRYEIGAVLPSVAMAAQLARAVGASLDQLCGLAATDSELVILARKLCAALSDQQQQALCAALRVVLEVKASK